MKEYQFFLTSSLEKVFPDERPKPLSGRIMTVLAGELPAVQLVVYEPVTMGQPADIRPAFDITVEGAPVPARLRRVELIPSDFPVYTSAKDDDYLRTAPGLFPDLLRPMDGIGYLPVEGQYRSIWIDFPRLETEHHGTYDINVTARSQKTLRLGTGVQIPCPENEFREYVCGFQLKVLPVRRPADRLIHTEWFHTDCLAGVYGLEIWPEPHWTAIENYIRFAADEIKVNALLTPVFTPPLDTAIGGERPTVQLVGIVKEGEIYRFDFDKLSRWCGLCRKYGIAYIEIPHFFTQWGARATPKIVADADGERRRIFGWDVPADSPLYRQFLASFIPALQDTLARLGYDWEHVIYHISDEPQGIHGESYRIAESVVADFLRGCTVIDALSDYSFYEEGLVKCPVPSVDHIEPFLEHHVPNLWTYYCCSQSVNVPNRFFAMPSARNRIMGILMYLYDIRGFLHWGYNFYYSQFSLRLMNPFLETHCDYAFPSGDAYLVYPGENLQPLASVRSQVQRNALDDLACLHLLEELTGRKQVVDLIDALAKEPVTFQQYPRDPEFIFELRELAGQKIEAALDAGMEMR